MIVTIFWAVLVISLVLIVLGVAFEYPESAIIGFTFLFILGTVFLFTGLQYQTGESVTMNATAINANLTQTISTTTYNYTTYKNHNIGFWLCVLGLAGFVASLLNVRRAREA